MLGFFLGVVFPFYVSKRVLVCATVGSAHRGQNRALAALGLELEASVGHHVGAGTALTSSMRALNALNHSAISPASST